MAQINFNKIIFCEYPLKIKSQIQGKWFYNLLSYYARTVTDLPVYCLSEKNTDPILYDDYLLFDTELFYSFYGYKNYFNLTDEEKNELWVKIFYNTEFNKEAYDYVHSVFDGAIVISHELESVLCKILEHYNIPYIDLNTDPIRFLDDQMFAFRSNDGNVYQEILKYRPNEEIFYAYANYLKTTYRKSIHDETGMSILLFCGQTICDKTLIDKNTGTTYSILENKEAFEKLIKGYDRVYYKKHPANTDNNEIAAYLESLKIVEITEEKFYKLLSRRDITKVASISSGTCIEAKYFNKEVENLLQESIELQTDEEFDKNKYIHIYKNFLSLGFWATILNPLTPTKNNYPEVNFDHLKNLVRNRGTKVYWGYEDFEHGLIVKDALSAIKASTESIQRENPLKLKIAKTIKKLKLTMKYLILAKEKI